MKIKTVNRLFHTRYPSLDWIQIEISSYCNGECIYCPRTVYRHNWKNRYLSKETFQALTPAFKKTRLVYLQGWGEPFTHPDFFKLVRIAKSAAAMVGTTTNGNLINERLAERIVNSGMDILAFSLAGTDEKNDAIRKGTKIKTVLSAIKHIHRAKHKYAVNNPKIHIAYMLLRSGLNDLENLSDFLINTGVDQTVVSSLSFVPHLDLIPESVLANSENKWNKLKNTLIAIQQHAIDSGTDVRFHMVSPFTVSLFPRAMPCSENVTRAMVVGSDGTVSPCVMKNLPLSEKNYYYFNNQKILHQNLKFGDIHKNPLNHIWHQKTYRQFVRLSKRGSVPTSCKDCYKRYIDRLEPDNSWFM